MNETVKKVTTCIIREHGHVSWCPLFVVPNSNCIKYWDQALDRLPANVKPKFCKVDQIVIQEKVDEQEDKSDTSVDSES